jgi:hypothetical protein
MNLTLYRAESRYQLSRRQIRQARGLTLVYARNYFACAPKEFLVPFITGIKFWLIHCDHPDDFNGGRPCVLVDSSVL